MVTDLVNEMVARSRIEPLARAMYGWVARAGRHEGELRQVMDRIVRPNSNCVDVGCGRGQVLKEMLRRAPQGQHFALEPDPDRFARLKASFPRVTCFHVAASDKAGDGTIPAAQAPTGLIARRCAGSTDAPRAVLTARLDELLPGDLAVRLLRVNLRQGLIPALQGAVQIIRRCHPFLVFHFAPQEGESTAPGEVYEFLTVNGLAISLLDDWLSGHSPIAHGEFIDLAGNRVQSWFLAHP